MKYLAQVVERFSSAHVLVLGDPMHDVYHHGRVSRISQEAPVPIFIQESIERRAGGSMNVCNNLRSLGVKVRTVYPCSEYAFTEKHRYLVGHQQIFRWDHDVQHDALTMEAMAEQLDWAHVVVLADYGKGCLSEAFCQEVILATRTRWKHVIVDPRGGDWNKYTGATVILPNERELEEHAAIKLGVQPVFPYVLKKLGSRGMQLWVDGGSQRARFVWESQSKARQVFDVTGAGDTVIATFAAVVSHPHHDLVDAAELANLAAGVVVGKVGTSTCSKQELLQEIEHGSGSEAAAGETSRPGAPRKLGREYGEEARPSDRDRDPLSATGGGAAAGGEAPG